MAERVPPGRAGRLWLRGRLAVARRGVELLDRKRQLLRREQTKLAELRADAARRWTTACAEAETWGLRVALLGGTGGIAVDAAGVAGQGRIEVTWRNTMGVRHPDAPRCTLPVLAPSAAAAGNAAVAPAAAAYRAAVEAAAAYAAADLSFALLDEELHATERRLRAIERHRLPGLEGALHELELRLDELEREERVVTRWAQRRQQGTLRGPGAVPEDEGPRARAAREGRRGRSRG